MEEGTRKAIRSTIAHYRLCSTVIVDGKTLVQQGKSVLFDEADIYARAKRAVQQAWQAIPAWHWGGYDIDRIVPPAFKIHRT